MIKFLQKNLPLCNKTNCIQIHIGNIISNNIVDIKLNKKHIENILYYLNNTLNLENNTSNLDNKPTFERVYEYRYGNEIYMKKNNEFISISYQILKSIIEEQYYIRVIENIVDMRIPQSIEKYDDITEYDLMIISNNGMFEYEIRHYLSQDYYTFIINIKKPIMFGNIYNIITEIKKLLN